jgi:hypothetical protein
LGIEVEKKEGQFENNKVLLLERPSKKSKHPIGSQEAAQDLLYSPESGVWCLFLDDACVQK